MRDEERIEMYYKYGVLDWQSEQALQAKEYSRKPYSLRAVLVRVLPSVIENVRALKIKSRKKLH